MLTRSCQLYKKLHEKTAAAVELADQGKFDAVAEAVTEFTSLLDEIKELDSQINSRATENAISNNQTLWDQRVQIMGDVHHYHTETLPILSSKLAMNQAELQKIRKGIKGMNGYHSGTQQTGQRIKNSL